MTPKNSFAIRSISLLGLFIFMLSFLFNSFSFHSNILYAESKVQYAKIIGSNVKLYRSTSGSEDISNIFFVIPKSYYVILQPCEDEGYYSAIYIDEEGFVKKNEVQCVKGVPSRPFADNISFRVFSYGGADLRSSPIQSDGTSYITSIQFLETNLIYYGGLDGEQFVSHRSSEWYYTKYFKNGKHEKGYVYSVFCDLLTEIPENTEMLEYIDEAIFEIKETGGNGLPNSELSSLPSLTQVIIIIAVSLPCIFIIYLLFRPTKITSKVMESAAIKEKRRPRKKVKSKDYYEYQE